MNPTCLLAFAFGIAATALHALPTTWPEPSGGYSVTYEASSGVTPYLTEPYWEGDPFQGALYGPQDSYVTTDALTQEPVLYIKPTTVSEWDSYSLTTSPGSGTVNDRLTIDFRFRLLDPDFSADPSGEPGTQFNVAVWRPDALGEGSRRFMVQFTTESVFFYDGAEAAYPIGTDWHDVRITINPSIPMAYLYIDGDTVPLLADQGTPQAQAERNWLYFGHQGGFMGGEVNLSHFSFTTQEIAQEPAVSADTAAFALAITKALELSFDATEGHLYQVQALGEDSEWVDVGGNIQGTGERENHLVSLVSAPDYRVLSGAPTWTPPANGFTVDYDASSGWTPGQSEPVWDAAIFGEFYTEQTATMVVDDITGETVLRLEDPNGSAAPNPNYVLNHSGGAGTAADQVTFEIRFRLLDENHAGNHFNFGIWRPSPREGRVQRYTFSIYLNRLEMLWRGGRDYDFGTRWNTIRMTIDGSSEFVNLYVNGSEIPLLAATGNDEGATQLSGIGDRNAVYFGHQGGDSVGPVHIAYVRFTNGEIPEEVTVPLEPFAEVDRADAVELFFTGLAGRTYRLDTASELGLWSPAADPFFLGTRDPLRSLHSVNDAGDRQFFQYTEILGAVD